MQNRSLLMLCMVLIVMKMLLLKGISFLRGRSGSKPQIFADFADYDFTKAGSCKRAGFFIVKAAKSLFKWIAVYFL
jgi:hypothetical protein